MRHISPALLLSVVGVLASTVPVARAVDLVEDRKITLRSATDVAERRNVLLQHIWGGEGFPTRLPEVVANIANPIPSVTGFSRVEELRVDMIPGLQGLAWHFVREQTKGGLVVVHHGHSASFDGEYGLVATINALLREGYGVLAVFMPHKRPGDDTGKHNEMFELKTTGSPMKWFLESTAVSLNYLKTLQVTGQTPLYRNYHMVGLSGGGWTTTVYAAIDPSIRVSVPVAGTIPLYLRTRGSVGDREQTDPAFYRLAGYPDLYLMGSHGRGRQQIQILNRRDTCCFGQAQHDEQTLDVSYDDGMRGYAAKVEAAAKEIGDTQYRLVIDETAPGHLVSDWAITEVLLLALEAAK